MKIVEYTNSSNIDKTSYDEDKQIMYVKFKSGGNYSYEGVPADVYKNMNNSESVGRYFHNFIKNKFPYKKISSF